MDYLIIVESPNKCKKIQGYLKENFPQYSFKVIASLGHLNELATNVLFQGLGFELKNFKPKFTVIPEKEDVKKTIIEEARKAKNILLASDPDREGEAISWHVANILTRHRIDKTIIKRMIFNEITSAAIKKSFENPIELNEALINSQVTRQILDRIIGFKISWFLQKQNYNYRSAGRVQSVALKLIIERYQEYAGFDKLEYWRVLTNYQNHQLALKLEDEKALRTHEMALSTINQFQEQLELKSIKRNPKTKQAYTPLTTSDALQLANKRLGYSIEVATKYFQTLFEKGLITYPRTDAKRYDEEFWKTGLAYVTNKFGAEYALKTATVQKKKEHIQDAHESIRVTKLNGGLESARRELSDDNLYALYEAIYKNTLYSLFEPVRYANVEYTFSDGQFNFISKGIEYDFLSYLQFEKEIMDDEDEDADVIAEGRWQVAVGDRIQVPHSSWTPKQCFTKPQPLYTEATLVEKMEKEGVGRPASYANMISTIFKRQYIDYQKDKKNQNKKQLIPTELGIGVYNDYLKIYFSDLINEKYTAQMETSLDAISNNKLKKNAFLTDFWNYFQKIEGNAYAAVNTGRKKCPDCDHGYMVEKFSKSNGKPFQACNGYPRCTHVEFPKPTHKPQN